MSVLDHVGVLGGGRMGAGIAHSFLTSGAQVTIVESSEAAAQAALDRVRASLAKAAERGSLAVRPAAALERLTVTPDRGLLNPCTLIIEAVPERADLKTEVLAAAEKAVPDTWLATNTSSLSIDVIATALAQPSRLIGLHFFNPVPASELVEIVVGQRTSQELVKLCQEWVEGLHKTAITVRDSPGFASSRLGVAIGLEAMKMVEEGVASAEDIDAAMTLGYRHPMGPLRTTDMVGLDVRLAIAEHLAHELGPRFEPPALLREKVERGELGMKTGQGFFNW